MGRSEWERVARSLDFAFQPIVRAASGRCLGLEALIRGFEPLGFGHPFHVFDAAYADGALYMFDLLLRRRAVEKFASVPHHETLLLFYNLDNRLLDMPDYTAGNTLELLAESGLQPDQLCFEVSERHEVSSEERIGRLLSAYKRQGFRIALDDFGSGYSALRLLDTCEPDFVKLDGFFVRSVQRDLGRRRFMRHLVEGMHGLGMSVVAEGIESQTEAAICAALGCDALQGYAVQAPTRSVADLSEQYVCPGRPLAGCDTDGGPSGWASGLRSTRGSVSRSVHAVLTGVSPTSQ